MAENTCGICAGYRNIIETQKERLAEAERVIACLFAVVHRDSLETEAGQAAAKLVQAWREAGDE